MQATPSAEKGPPRWDAAKVDGVELDHVQLVLGTMSDQNYAPETFILPLIGIRKVKGVGEWIYDAMHCEYDTSLSAINDNVIYK